MNKTMNATDITDMTDAELDALLDRRSWDTQRARVHAEMKRLGTLSRAELTALGDRNARRCANPAHLASAIAKLNNPDATRDHVKPGPLAGQTPRAYRH
jgi:hypothetical protein